MKPLLQVKNIEAFYGDFQALFGLSFSVFEGEKVSFIGANGAGKSTLMRCLTGLLPVRQGEINFCGNSLIGMSPSKIVREGLTMVPEGRQLFPSLSLEENLLVGAYGKRPGMWSLSRVYEIFPALEERRYQSVTTLSGGQQQMVAVGRALMTNPKILLCDELSLGLAPVVIKGIYEAVMNIQSEGLSLVIVEQDVRQALRISDKVYCLAEGKITLSGTPVNLSLEEIRHAYFGTKMKASK